MCFSVGWLLHLLVVLIVVCAVVAILRIWVFPLLSSVDGRITQTVSVVVWVFAAVFAVYVCFELLACLLGGGLGTAFR